LATKFGDDGDVEKFVCQFSFGMRQRYAEAFSDKKEILSLAKSFRSAKKMEGGATNGSFETFQSKYILDGNEYPFFISLEKYPEGNWLIGGF
jgi:hypothetical protein